MTTRSILVASALTAALTSPLCAAPISAPYKVVRSGTAAPMGFHYDLGEGCRTVGPVTINLITPPQNGRLSTASRRGHPSFRSSDALAACNRTRVEGLEVYYQSAPGYVGPDSYVVERVFPNGDARRFRIDVSVR